MNTRVKICGITRPEDAAMCSELGVDAIGLVFYPPSKRYIDSARARDIIDALPPFMMTVALFMNATADEVDRVISTTPIDRLQFHGDESGEFCGQFGTPYFKALAMGNGSIDMKSVEKEYDQSMAFLLDSHKVGQAGGSGHIFDWNDVPQINKPLIVAGGIGPDNVQSAIEQLNPYAIDCSSGVEATPGIKDREKVRLLMEKVSNA